ncbi:MAG: redox-sensing transcriptional repressor Rex [Clostridia bacterium]|nr:redox-sensing transcriptional repressor Rex [Clostridia bacterium]
MSKYISTSVIKRLPRYYRFLGNLKKQNIKRISSGELARRMNLTASQVRQDFNCFGGFGQQGYGYSIDNLYEEIGKILGIDEPMEAVMFGVGNLGHVVANNMDFKKLGFELVGLFDVNPEIIGTEVAGMTVLDTATLEDFCNEHNPKAAFICVPTSAVKELTDRLVALGVLGFWNFSHFDIALEHPSVAVENVHFTDTLMRLSYKIKKGQ